MSGPDFDAIAVEVSPEQLAQAIGARPSRSQGEYHCPGPGHENGDKKESLSINRKDGRTVAFCHSCGLKGTPVQVTGTIWSMAPNDAAERLVSELGITTAGPTQGPGAYSGNGLGELIDTYEYVDESGGHLFEVCRYVHPKGFRQRVKQGSGHSWSVKGVRRVLYRLPEVVAGVEADRHILLVEGEKDADDIAGRGFVGTTCPGGAGKWRAEYSESLRGAKVCVLPDNDEQGRKHAQQVAEALHGIAAEVRVLELPDLPDKGDVSDWFEAGGTAGDLKELVTDCPIWDPESDKTGPRVRCMADVEAEEVTWLWGSRIPRGKLTEIVGDPGVGKSTLTTAIVASLSTGSALPGDGFSVLREPADVLLLSAEDGAGDTIRPRLDRAGADVSRVHLFDGINTLDGGLAPFDLRNSLHRLYLADLIEELGVGLLVIDPLTAYLGGVDSHKDSDVRGVLMPLAEIAESSGCAILTVRHLNKGSTTRAIYRAGGSIAFTAAVRSSMLVGQADEESDERAIVTIKSNLAAFPPPVGFSLEDGQFEWTTGTPDVAASDLLKSDTDSEERSDRKMTAEWLLGVLRGGPMASVDIFKKADVELSVSKATVKRAKSSLGDSVVAYRESKGNEGGGRWVWKFARVSPPPDPLAKLETDPLARPVVAQGFSVSGGSQGAQGSQGNRREPLADSDDDNGLFDNLPERDAPDMDIKL